MSMSAKDLRRNVAVIAHVDHGKSSLTDALVSHEGLLSDRLAGSARWTDAHVDSVARGITIKSAAVRVTYGEHTVCVVDSPGHIDFSAEVSAALRVVDGALLVVCAAEGVSVQTETVLAQALGEGLRVVLVINKVDRLVSQLKLPPRDAWARVRSIVEGVNALIAARDPEAALVDAAAGSVVLASAREGWAVTLRHFAEAYKVAAADLWEERAFGARVWRPLAQLLEATEGSEALTRMAERLGVPRATYASGAAVLRAWAPAARGLLEAIIGHVPPPSVAQGARGKALWGSTEDEGAEEEEETCREGAEEMAEVRRAVAACDASAGPVVYVSKLVPADAAGARELAPGTRFVALVRVFAGRLAAGTALCVASGGKESSSGVAVVQRVAAPCGARCVPVEAAHAGDVVVVAGLEALGVRAGHTLCGAERAGRMQPLRGVAHVVAPVVRIAVWAARAADGARVAAALRNIARVCPQVVVESEEGGPGGGGGGRHVVSGAGELQLDIVLRDAERLAGAPISRGRPVVPYREAIGAPSGVEVVVRSENRLNKLVVAARPLEGEEAAALAEGRLRRVPREIARGSGVVVVDATRGVTHVQDARDALAAALAEVEGATGGALCGEPLRGVRVDLLDATLHGDTTHRAARHLIPAARRGILAAQLTAGPHLLEPVYLCEVRCAGGGSGAECLGGVLGALARRRATVLGVDAGSGVRAHLPVASAFGLAEELRGVTSGRAAVTCVFDHWRAVPGDVHDAGTPAGAVVAEVRTRKGLKAVPRVEDLVDRMDLRGARTYQPEAESAAARA